MCYTIVSSSLVSDGLIIGVWFMPYQFNVIVPCELVSNFYVEDEKEALECAQKYYETQPYPNSRITDSSQWRVQRYDGQGSGI